MAGACSEQEAPESLRHGRFGVLRDLVLFQRPGAPFFLDRFESTQADWAEYRGTASSVAGGSEVGNLPVTGIDLWQARELARWRFCRVQREDEWSFAATGGGQYEYPWGKFERASWTNTAELGLGELTPVGTFESGRRGDGPYDLVGNCAEWTETVLISWFRSSRNELRDFTDGLRRVDANPALRAWGWGLQPYPALLLVQAATGMVPRIAVGGNFLDPMTARRELRLPGDRSAALGVRLAADPRGILVALMQYRGELADWEQELISRFVARPGHREVLREAFPGALAELADAGREPGPLGELLAWELDL